MSDFAAAKSKFFLKEALSPVDNEEDLSTKLAFFELAINLSPEKFKRLGLDEQLSYSINDGVALAAALNRKKCGLLNGLALRLREATIIDLEDLQPRLDLWLFTKMLGLGDKYKVKDKLIKKFLSKKRILETTDPADAVLLYIYIRILLYCDSKYAYLAKYIPHLERITKKDPRMYAYFLTHIILYDTNFGLRPPPKKAIKVFKKLHTLCEHDLPLWRENVDLFSEIIICCRICKLHKFPHYPRLLEYILQTNDPVGYHEKATLAAATF